MAVEPAPIVIALDGEFDLLERDRLVDVLADAAGATRLVVLNLAETTYLDSCALGAFVKTQKTMKDAGSTGIALASAGGHVRRILEISGLLSVLPLFETVEAALLGAGADRTAASYRLVESRGPDTRV